MLNTSKTFDCVHMKWDIQQQLAEESAEMSDNDAYAMQMERVRRNPILGPFLQKVAQVKKPMAKAH
jgi:hypothetical protein